MDGRGRRGAVELEVGAVDDDQTAGAGGELVEERASLADLEAAPDLDDGGHSGYMPPCPSPAVSPKPTELAL